MNVNHYTPVHLSKKPFQLSTFFNAHFEPLLVSMIVLTGIIGSVYLFGHNFITGNSNNSDPTSPASIAAMVLDKEEDKNTSNIFDKLVKIPGTIKAGQNFDFSFLGDEKASRYVMEMGDGVRLIVTQKNLLYNYEAPGKYTIELKQHQDGLLTLIGTKKIKVK